ncbi:MAG: hypothetical protein K9G48_05365 [Reyranella sp.]|nr:hypothetical protein [Reyranella sp.]
MDRYEIRGEDMPMIDASFTPGRHLVFAGVEMTKCTPQGKRRVAKVAYAKFCSDSAELSAATNEAARLGHVGTFVVSLEDATELAKLLHPGLVDRLSQSSYWTVSTLEKSQ